MAYTFLRAQGVPTGESLVEQDKVELAKSLLEEAGEKLPDLTGPKLDSKVLYDAQNQSYSPFPKLRMF